MGHVLVRLVKGVGRQVQLPRQVFLQQVQEESVGPFQVQELGLPQPQAAQVLQVALEDQDLVVQQVLLQQELVQQVQEDRDPEVIQA